MAKKIIGLLLLFCLTGLPIGNAIAYNNHSLPHFLTKTQNAEIKTSQNEYWIQWQQEYGNEWDTGARFQGPQSIGDCDNDGKNELLIGGTDPNLRVMKWDEKEKTYIQSAVVHPPFYPFVRCGCGGFAIGDLTGDGKNEIATTWNAAIYQYRMGRYWMIGMNSWIFRNGGGSADCYIGDCDNDGKNDLIMSGGPYSKNSTIPLITIFKWNGWRLVKVASWDNDSVPPRQGSPRYVYMSGLGDVDDDGLNEIVCAYANKIFVLKWNTQHHAFDSQVIFDYPYDPNNPNDEPFSVVCKDCDNDGKAEILLGYFSSHFTIFKWNGTEYRMQYDWRFGGYDFPGVIEGIDVGDTDNDGRNEICVGTGIVRIFEWSWYYGYEQTTVLPTYGTLSVVSIGDCDNDGKNEINVANVMVEHPGQQYMEWVFKYGWINN
jgi:hypothetical protein